MTAFEYDYEFSLPDGGSVVLDVDTGEEGEALAYEYVRNTFPEALNVEVTGWREVNQIS